MRTLRSICLIIFTVLVTSPLSYAESFQDWKSQQQGEFSDYKKQLLKEFEEYKRKTGAVWGKDNVTPDSSQLVSYINDIGNRSVVDLENGTIEVDVAVPDDGKITDEQARKQLKEVLLGAMSQGVDDRPIREIARQPVSRPHGPAVLKGQIGDSNGNEVKSSDYNRIAKEAANRAKKKKLKGDDGRSRFVYTTQLKLVPDHIQKRAGRYKSIVERYAREQEVPVSLVFAVMEVESYFDPTARSGAPAFGLMQLIPTQGARDAYRYVHKKDRIVSDRYLYNPDNNVRLGSAYLHILYYKYLDGIESNESKMLCSIASYNGGSGDVWDAFAGRFSKARFGNRAKQRKIALKEINKRTPQEVYNHMRRNLPRNETRDYIKKVTERMPKYEAI